MRTIEILPINHYDIEERIELQTQGSATFTQLFDNYKEKLQEEYGVECNLQFGQVVMYETAKPTLKLTGEKRIQEIAGGDLELSLIFPKINTPIVECRIAEADYFIYDYTKNDMLEIVLKKVKGPPAALIQQGKIHSIRIKGREVNYSKVMHEKFQKFMEGSINANIKIEIECPDAQEEKEAGVIPDIPQEQPQQKVETIQSANLILNAPLQVKQEQPPKPELQPAPKQENKPELPKPEQPPNPPPKKLADDHIQLILKFESIVGAGGRRELALDALRTKSMKQLLPQIIARLKEDGFDWGTEEYDHARDRDKLHITLDSNHFKKIDKPLKQLVNSEHKQIVFGIDRHYEGGAPMIQ